MNNALQFILRFLIWFVCQSILNPFSVQAFPAETRVMGFCSDLHCIIYKRKTYIPHNLLLLLLLLWRSVWSQVRRVYVSPLLWSTDLPALHGLPDGTLQRVQEELCGRVRRQQRHREPQGQVLQHRRQRCDAGQRRGSGPNVGRRKEPPQPLPHAFHLFRWPWVNAVFFKLKKMI